MASKKKGAAPPAGMLEITVRRGENLNNSGAGFGDREIDPYVKILPSWLPKNKKASWKRTGGCARAPRVTTMERRTLLAPGRPPLYS